MSKIMGGTTTTPVSPKFIRKSIPDRNKILDFIRYTISNNEVTITDCPTSEPGAYTIPAFIEGCPVVKINSAFHHTDFTSIRIPNGVVTIGDNAFYDCGNLSTVYIPDSVTSIGEYAFDSTNLSDVYYEGSEEQWAAISVEHDNAPLLNANIHFNQKPATMEDVMNHTPEINLDEYVKNTDLATSVKAGLIDGSGTYGARIMTNTPSATNLVGRLAGITKNAEQYKDLHSEFFICKGTLDNIKNQYVKEGLTANTETLTDEEKAAALKWLGLDDIGVGGNKYIIFDTPTKKQYSSNYWARMVDERWGMNWSDVQNLQECKVGDTGILLGYNTTTKSNVMLLCEITGINEVDWLVETVPIACFQGLELGTGVMPLVQSHSIYGYPANFELKKGFVYLFTVHGSDNNSAKIVNANGDTICGVECNALEGFKTGIIVCADLCTAVGLKDKLTVLNLTSFMLNDRWSWGTEGACYLQTTSDNGIDIWEL